MGLLSGDGLLVLRTGMPGLHGACQLRPETLPPRPDGGFRSLRVGQSQHDTESGRAILSRDPNSEGSLGIAISEAVEAAARDPHTKYALGNHGVHHKAPARFLTGSVTCECAGAIWRGLCNPGKRVAIARGRARMHLRKSQTEISLIAKAIIAVLSQKPIRGRCLSQNLLVLGHNFAAPNHCAIA